MFLRVPRVDDLHHTDEGEAGAPGSAVPAGGGDSRRGADARRREFARVPHAEWEADLGVDAAQDAPAPDRGCGARLPPVVPGLACVDASVNASFFFGWFGACGQVLSCVRPH